jgi:acetyl esterase/lipase
MLTTMSLPLVLPLAIVAAQLGAADEAPRPGRTAATTQSQDADARFNLHSNVAFLPEGRTERLDVYSPRGIGKDARLPAVVFIHVGGWGKGDKADARSLNIGSTLAAEGFVCASINYQLAPPLKPDETPGGYTRNLRLSFPQNVQDCKSAVRHLRTHANKYNIDPDRIAVMGASAGAHLAAMVAYNGPDDGLEPKDDGYGKVSSRVRALIGLYGVYEWASFDKKHIMTEADKELARKASPLTYLDKSDPPTYAIHGTKDIFVPRSQTLLLEAKLKELAVVNQVVIVEGAPHQFDFRLKLHDLRSDVLAFLGTHLKAK